MWECGERNHVETLAGQRRRGKSRMSGLDNVTARTRSTLEKTLRNTEITCNNEEEQSIMGSALERGGLKAKTRYINSLL